MTQELLDNILLIWIPYGFGIIGIIVFLSGVLKLVTGRDRAIDSIFSGIVIFIIGIALRFILAFALDQLRL
jgi:hypothetical protein